MGSITTIKRRPLASAAVGTPGVDFSDAQALSSLAFSSAQIGQQIQQNRAITDQVQVLKEAQVTNEEYQRGIAEIQSRYNSDSSLDPADGVKEIKNLGAKISARRLPEIKNKNVRGGVALKHEQLKIQRANDANTWALKLQGINMLSNGAQAINGLTNAAEALSGDDTKVFGDFEALLTQGKEAARVTAAGVGAKEGSKIIENAPKSIAQGYLNGLMKRDPEKGLEEFKTKGIFNTLFNAKEREKLEEGFADAISGKKLTTNISGILDGNKVFEPFKAGLSNNDLDISQIQQGKLDIQKDRELTPSEERTFAHLEKVALDKKYTVTVDNAENIINIKNKILDLGLKKGGLEIDNKDVQLADLFEVTMDVWQSVGKNMSAQSAGVMLEPVYAAMKTLAQEKDPGFFESAVSAIPFVNILSVESTGLKKINDRLDMMNLTENKRKNIDADMTIKFLFKLFQNNENGIETTKGQVNDIINNIFKESAAEFNLPELSEGVSLLDPKTGARYNFINGDYVLVA